MSARSLVRPEGYPTLHYSHRAHELKGEDVVFVCDGLQTLCPDPQSMGKWDLFCVCDGHGGPEAAEFVRINLPRLLASELPKGLPPETDSEEGQTWLQTVRNAVNTAFVQLDLDFKKESVLPTVGCTTTIALLCGWILTVANVGDSEACLDLGSGIPVDVTISHKIDTNLDEQIRLSKCGKDVRPLSEELFRPARSYEEGVGPLRVWPCGLAVSRAIGDTDCGREILASPHITQISVPFAGARLIVASDGLWDHLTAKRVVKRSRKHVVKDTPSELISKARKVSAFGLTDDTTVLVVDILPTPKVDFRDISKKVRGPRQLLSKFRGSFGRNKKKGYPSVILISEDMAPAEVMPYPSIRSIVSTSSSKDIRPKDQPVLRTKTFTAVPRDSSESDSHEEEGLNASPDRASASRNSDGHGVSSPGCSLRRYHSSSLDYA